ncbi:MAG: universal stress protein [Pyrinomonadaceae bacterium]
MKILIATDGSDFSREAVLQSCQMVIDSNDEILIASCYEDAYPISAEPFALSADYYQKMEDAMSELSMGFTEDAKASIEEKFVTQSPSISTEVLRGSPEQRIVERAEEWGADLIVVGSHGRGFWGRLLGSVSNGVVHHAPCTVLVVRKPVGK